jgi:hypothetical protein
MNIYPVAEHELESIYTMNMLTTVLLTVGVGLISIGIGILVNLAFVDKVTPEGNVLAKFGVPILMFLGLVCMGFCKWTQGKRNAIWAKINFRICDYNIGLAFNLLKA